MRALIIIWKRTETGEQPLTRDELNFMKGILGLFGTKVSEIGRDQVPRTIIPKIIESMHD